MINLVNRIRWCTILLTVALLLGCGGAEERKAKYMERGKTYFEAENYSKAKIEFQNVLQIDPKTSEAWYYLAKIHESNEKIREAFAGYRKAAELDPENVDANRQLARYYLVIGDTEKTKEITDRILEKNPADHNARVMRGSLLSLQGDAEGAEEIAKQVLMDAPDNTRASMLLANLYAQKNKLSDAEVVLKDAIKHDPEDPVLRLRLADIYAKDDKGDQGAAVLQELIDLYPDKVNYRIALASYYSKYDRLDEAEQVIRASMEVEPTDIKRHLLLADFLLNKRGMDAVEQHLVSAIKLQPELTQLQFVLANIYQSTERIDKSEDIYRNIIVKKGDEPEALEAKGHLAGIDILKGDREEAAELVESVLAVSPTDNQALIVKSKLAIQNREFREAVSLLRTVLKDQPDSLEVLMLLGIAHRGNGEHGLAGDSLRKAVKLYPEMPQGRLGLLQFLFESKDFDGALEQAELILERDPDNFLALIGKSDVLAEKKETAELKKTLEMIKQVAPDKPDGYFRMGRFYMAHRDYPNAYKEFTAAYKLVPGSPDLLADIVKVEMALGKKEDVLARLEKVVEQDPENPVAHRLLAAVYLKDGNPAAAEKEYVKQISATPRQYELYPVLAEVRLDLGDIAGAEQAFTDGLKVFPDDFRLLLGLANFLEGQQEFEKAAERYEQILAKAPGYIVAVNNMAALIADHKRDPDSLQRAKQLALKLADSGQPALLDTLGCVHYRLGEIDEAVSVLSKVVDEAPQVGIYQYHLGMAYLSKGDKKAAKYHLTKALDTRADFFGKEEARVAVEGL